MPPVINSLNPTSGPVGSNVLITGSGFIVGGAIGAVKFNGVSAATFSYTGTQIIVAVPLGATTGPVTVTVAGQTSNGITFTVTALGVPTITSLSPTSGAIGLAVSIGGTNFGTMQGSSVVSFSGGGAVRAIATATSWSPTNIVVTVPPGAQTGSVLVVTSGGTSNPSPFTVVGPSNGGLGAPLGLLLIPAQQFNTQVVLTFDPTNFNDPNNVSFYKYKVEEILAGRTPTCSRQIITYRDLGVASITCQLSGYDQNAQAVVTQTSIPTIGTLAATQSLATLVLGMTLTAQNLQFSIERDPSAGPVSIVKVQLEGRVEMTKYA